MDKIVFDDKFEKVGAFDFADKDKQKGYAETIQCLNCHWREQIYVPFGITKKEYLKSKRCKRCKCGDVLF